MHAYARARHSYIMVVCSRLAFFPHPGGTGGVAFFDFAAMLTSRVNTLSRRMPNDVRELWGRLGCVSILGKSSLPWARSCCNMGNRGSCGDDGILASRVRKVRLLPLA